MSTKHTPRAELKKKQKLFQCDCCGEMVPRDEISFTFAFGMDTAACDKCRDWNEELTKFCRLGIGSHEPL
jgi:hypothetical protein